MGIDMAQDKVQTVLEWERAKSHRRSSGRYGIREFLLLLHQRLFQAGKASDRYHFRAI
jgi:hypothetical protein